MDTSEKKENQRIALTKRLLQEGLLRLLETKELPKISVTELCRESGINRATFYKYYGCPGDVLKAVKEQFFQELLESQKQDACQRPLTHTEAFGKICAYLYERKSLSKCIIRNLEFNFSELWEKLSQERCGIYEHLSKNFDPESANLASTFINSGGYCMIRQWLTEDIQKTPKEMASIVQKLVNDNLDEPF